MTGLTTDILEVILKSQLQIENAVLLSLEKPPFGSSNDTLKKVTEAKLQEIRRQIKVIEEIKNV